jgi:tetratricopeptide (TPR) repeat protein
LSASDLRKVSRPTTDPGLLDTEANNFLNAGIELMHRRGGTDLERSISCLRNAIALQPESSAAHAALAKALTFKVAYESSQEALPEATDAARKAVALAFDSDEAHLALAAVLFHRGQLKEALEEALVSLECSSTSRRGVSLLTNLYKSIGRPDKALAWEVTAKESDRSAAEGDANVGDCLSYLLEDEKANDVYEHYFRLHPEQPDGWMGICRLHLLNGRLEQARGLYQMQTKGYTDFAYATQMRAQVEFFARNFTEATYLYAQLDAAQPDGGGSFYGAVSYKSALGRMRIEAEPAAGRKLLLEARRAELQLLETATEHPASSYRLAAIEASLGAVDSALDYLRTAVEAGWIDYRSTNLDPRFDSIRNNPRFQKYFSGMAARVAYLKQQRLVDSTGTQDRK